MRILYTLFIVLFVSGLVAAQSNQTTPTPTIPPTAIPVQPTPTVPPTATPVNTPSNPTPTATPVQPTPTVPPTATPTSTPKLNATPTPTATPYPISQNETPTATATPTIYCTQDVLQCADGSYVGRNPANNCQFYACITTNCPAKFDISTNKEIYSYGDNIVIKVIITGTNGNHTPYANFVLRKWVNGNLVHDEITNVDSEGRSEISMFADDYKEDTKLEFDFKTSVEGCENIVTEKSVVVKSAASTCLRLEIPTNFCIDGKIEYIYENNCKIDYECVYTEGDKDLTKDVPGDIIKYDDLGCPVYPDLVCKGGYRVGGGVLPGETCPSRATCCGNSVCEGRENFANCASDCSQPVCGNFVCENTEDSLNCPADCQFDEPPNKKVPEGCFEKIDENGFVHVSCEVEKQCPRPPKEAVSRCRIDGGQTIYRTDHRGCEIFECQFVQSNRGQIFQTYDRCMERSELDQIKAKCEAADLPFKIKSVGPGCNIAKCGAVDDFCPRITESEKKRIESECPSGFVTEDYNENGCPFLTCSSQCKTEVPDIAYQRCSSDGGELIVHRDENSCIAYSECVRAGKSDIYVDDIKELPSPTKLLSMAFKLEDLKIQLDKLARETENIANYYQSTGNPEEQRFRRVAGMFRTTTEKVDSIKKDLRDRIDTLTADDFFEIRHDIKYIKDVLIKDIVYVMLGSADEIKEIESGEVKDCGTNGECFDRAFRLCKPVTFKPEGINGPLVEIRGLEDNKCVMFAELPEDQGPSEGLIPGVNPPFEMTCKIQNYALGIDGPEEILPFCEGSMVEIMKRFGTESPRGENKVSNAPDAMILAFLKNNVGPEGCEGEECVKFCRENNFNCMLYIDQWLQENGGPGDTRSLLDMGQLCKSEPFTCMEWMQSRGVNVNELISSSGRENFEEQSDRDLKQPRRDFESDFTVPGDEFDSFDKEFRSNEVLSNEACIGCFDNGVCDDSECSYCFDCSE
jgi:hypothetical protein